MKRAELIRHLHAHDCELLREGSRHSWWRNRSVKQEIGRSQAQRNQRRDGEENL